MKTTQNKVAKVGTKATKQTETKQVISKTLAKKQSRVNNFTNDANSYERLLTASANATLCNLGLNKALKDYLDAANQFLTDKQKGLLTFTNVKNEIAQSKYASYTLFSFHIITLVCASIIRKNDNNTKRAERAAKQSKATAKK
jgi:hypothetical protein